MGVVAEEGTAVAAPDEDLAGAGGGGGAFDGEDEAGVGDVELDDDGDLHRAILAEEEGREGFGAGAEGYRVMLEGIASQPLTQMERGEVSTTTLVGREASEQVPPQDSVVGSKHPPLPLEEDEEAEEELELPELLEELEEPAPESETPDPEEPLAAGGHS